jgi:hypothetical protein
MEDFIAMIGATIGIKVFVLASIVIAAGRVQGDPPSSGSSSKHKR